MPFYVDYSTKRRNIDIKDASPMQFVICEAFGYIVTLEAVVNDYINHRNVTFEWDQIKGTPAVLSHPNELITTFEYTDTSDKIFRFYIDKDTAREKYIDCRVYHTPISFGKLGVVSATTVGTGVVRIVSREDTVYVNFSRTIVTNVIGEPAVSFGLEYIIPLDILELSTKLEVLYSPDAFNLPDEVIETWLPGSYPTTYTAIAGYYTWVLTVEFQPGVIKKYTSDIHVSNPSAGDTTGRRIIDDLAAIGFANSGTLVTNYEYIKNSVEINNEIGKNVGLVESTLITRYDNKAQNVLEDVTKPNIIGYTINTTSIAKLDPSGIGS